MTERKTILNKYERMIKNYLHEHGIFLADYGRRGTFYVTDSDGTTTVKISITIPTRMP